MRKTIFLVVLVLVLFLVGGGFCNPVFASQNEVKSESVDLGEISPFIKNTGQEDESLLFYSDNNWGRLSIRKNDIVFQIKVEENEKTFSIKNIYLEFPQNLEEKIGGFGEPISQLNYFIGNDPSNWHTEIPVYDSVFIENFYQGNNLVISSSRSFKPFISGVNEDQLKHLIKVKSNIPCGIKDGSLIAEIKDRSFVLNFFNDRVINQRNESQSLVWSTFLGGSKKDVAYQIVLDSLKNVYIAGSSESADIPTPNGYDQSQNSSSWSDIYVAKLSSTGNQLVWGTYIGGDTTDKAYSLAIDSEGNVLVGGQGTKNIPTPNGYLTSLPSDSATAMYLAKLSPSGSSLLWGTFIAGGQCGKLALDSSNNVVFVAETSKSTAPCPNGYDQTYNGGSSDLYIGKLSSQGNSLLWGTYLGGSNDDALNDDYYEGTHLDVKFSRDGNIIVGTTTKSSNIPTPNGYDTSINGLWDIYIAKLSSDGRNLLWGTYLGGSNDDKLGEINFDQSGNIVVTVSTRSTDIPVKNGYQMTHNAGYDGYVAKLSSDGSSLIWGTQLGGSKDDSLYSCDLDSEDNVILAGWTESSDMPVKNAYDNTWNTTIGGPDIYFAILKSDGSNLLEGSFLGGKYGEIAFSVVFDNIDSILLGGKTCSDDIPAINGFDSTLNNPTCGNYGTYDIYLAKFNVSSLVGCSMTCTASVPNYSKPNESVNFTSLATVDPPNCTNPSYDWDFGDGSAHSTTQNATHTYTAEKSYTWKLTVSGSEVPPCIKSGTITVTNSNCRLTCDASAPQSGVKNIPITFTATSTTQDCTSSVTYLWDFGDGQSSTSQNPSHTYTNAGTYNWTMTAKADSIPCMQTGTIKILSERPCVSFGQIKFCADSISNYGSKYTLAGNVSANDKLFFRDYVEIDLGSNRSVYTPGDIYVPDVHGADETVIKGQVKFCLNENGDGLKQTEGPLMYYSINLINLPLEIAGSDIRFDDRGVVVNPFINLGGSGFTIARVQAEILLIPYGDKLLLSMEVIEGDLTPSLSIASFSLTYDQDKQSLTGTGSIGFPFLDVASIDASVEFMANCIGDFAGLNGYSISVGLAEGIPLGPSGISLNGLKLEIDNICDVRHFYIFLGGDFGIDGVPSEILELADVGSGYQAPYTLILSGGKPQFLGYDILSLSGTITCAHLEHGKLYLPYIQLKVETNIAEIYDAQITIEVDISNFKISGGASGELQIPDWQCEPLNFFCRAIKALVELAIDHSLPYPIGDFGTEVTLGRVDSGKWGGTLEGMATLLRRSFAVKLSFINGDINFSIGENYENMIQIWLREERAVSPLGYEKMITVPSQQESVVFSAVGVSTLPEIYLVTPAGERLTKENYSSYPGAVYYESLTNNCTLFEISPTSAGNWTFGMSNLNQGDGDLLALGIHPKPQVTFGSVAPNSTGYSINFSVAPASEDTKVGVYYSDSPDYGNGLLIEDNLTSSDGNFSVDWDTSNIATGNYLIFVKADDGKNPDESFYYQNQLVVNKNVVAPPTNLTGLRTQESATLNWTPSTSENVAGYMLLYTDEPDVYGYKYRLSAVLPDTITVSELKLDKTYKFAVIAYDKDGNYSLESNSIKLANTPPPVITSMAKMGSPFRINVSGSNLQQGIKVKINGNLWSNVKWLSTSNIKIKGGSSLKSLVPKGVDTTFTFINPDGGETTVSWKY
jgi:PKD repeat protein